MSGLAAVLLEGCTRDHAECLVRGMNGRMIHRGGSGSCVQTVETGRTQRVLSMAGSLSEEASRRGEPCCPVLSPDGRRMLLFDGWLSNGPGIFEDARPVLPRGTGFSDAAAVLGAYTLWGDRLVLRLKGNWALLLADLEEKVLLGAVDRWGTRPLYCRPVPGGLHFASEIKAFTGHRTWKPVLDRQSGYEFLNWGVSDHTERTFFKGVFRFPQGGLVRFGFDATGWHDGQRRDWFVPPRGVFSGSFSDAAGQFKTLFERAVALRVSETRMGYAISGGLDSSSVACTAGRLIADPGRPPFAGFFVSSPFPGHDEEPFAREAASAAGCPLLTRRVSFEGFLEDLDDMILTAGEPFRTGRYYIHYLLCRLMQKEGIRVSMEGQGGDELLGGYHTFFLARCREKEGSLGMPQAFREAMDAFSSHGYSRASTALRVVDGCLPSVLREALRRPAGFQAEGSRWFRFKGDDRPSVKDPYGYYRGRTGSVRELSLDCLTRLLVPSMMRTVDRHAALAGIEARLPFLDEDLVDFCLSLPSEYLVKGGWTKRVLREAMKGTLPEAVRTRRGKMGMELPEELWFCGDGEESLAPVFREAVRSCGGLLSDKAYAIPGSRSAKKSTLPWKILIFGRWMALHGVDAGG